jgi:hypothetical protein
MNQSYDWDLGVGNFALLLLDSSNRLLSLDSSNTGLLLNSGDIRLLPANSSNNVSLSDNRRSSLTSARITNPVEPSYRPRQRSLVSPLLVVPSCRYAKEMIGVHRLEVVFLNRKIYIVVYLTIAIKESDCS